MELVISKNLKQAGAKLEFWQLLYCVNFNVKPKQFPQHLEKKLPELYALAEKSQPFKIDIQDNPYLNRHFEGEIAALRARGEGQLADYSLQNKTEILRHIAIHFSDTHQEEYRHLVDWFRQTEFPKEVIALLLQETLSKVYEKDTVDGKEVTYVKKREKGKTLTGHMSLNMITVPEIIDNTQGATKFADVYFQALEVLKEQSRSSGRINFDGVNTLGMGNWLKFDSLYTNPKQFHDNVQKLKALVANTPWCTRTIAAYHLSGGDFYVFVDNGDEEKHIEPQPHLAVRMSGGDMIEEVRGILEGQEIEAEYLPVAEDFLVNNKSIRGGRVWLEDMKLNKRFIAYNQSILDGTFKIEDIQDLAEDLGQETKQYGENSNKTTLLSNLPLTKPLFASHFGVPEDYITFDELEKYPQKWVRSIESIREVLTEHKKITSGHFSLHDTWKLVKTLGYAVSLGECNSKLTETRKMLMDSLPSIKWDIAHYFKIPASEICFGDLDLANSEKYGAYIVFGNVIDSRKRRIRTSENKYIKHFKRPRHPSKTLKYIVGNVNLHFGLTRSFNSLDICWGDFTVTGDNFRGAPNLRDIFGYLLLNTTRSDYLGMLRTARDGILINNSSARDLGNLENVEGSVVIVNSQLNNLFKLRNLPGKLTVINSHMPRNFNPEEVTKGITVIGYLDVPTLRRTKIIKVYGNLIISPNLETDVINYNYRDYSVQEFLEIRNRKIRNTFKLESDKESLLQKLKRFIENLFD